MLSEYFNNPLWLVEAMAVVAVFNFSYFLALKKRWAWLLYLLFCLGIIIVFWHKGFWLTVVNSFATLLLGIRNLTIWDWEASNRKKALLTDYLVIPWFTVSLILFWPGWILQAWWEVLMWFFIFTKQVLWGRKNAKGWWISLTQHIFAIGFNIVTGTYILLLRALVEIILALHGLYKWRQKH